MRICRSLWPKPKWKSPSWEVSQSPSQTICHLLGTLSFCLGGCWGLNGQEIQPRAHSQWTIYPERLHKDEITNGCILSERMNEKQDHPTVLLFQTHNSSLLREKKNQTNSNRGTFYKIPDPLKRAKVIKNKESLRNCHSQRSLKRHDD